MMVDQGTGLQKQLYLQKYQQEGAFGLQNLRDQKQRAYYSRGTRLGHYGMPILYDDNQLLRDQRVKEMENPYDVSLGNYGRQFQNTAQTLYQRQSALSRMVGSTSKESLDIAKTERSL